MEDKHKIPIRVFVFVGAVLFWMARRRTFRRSFFLFEETSVMGSTSWMNEPRTWRNSDLKGLNELNISESHSVRNLVFYLFAFRNNFDSSFRSFDTIGLFGTCGCKRFALGRFRLHWTLKKNNRIVSQRKMIYHLSILNLLLTATFLRL